MNEPRATRFLLRLFPADWRARYGEEFVALLVQTGISMGIVFDVLLAVVDAHLHPRANRRWPPMIQRMRRSELVIFLAWVAFAVAGSGFGWMTKDEPFVYLRDSLTSFGLAHDAVLIGAFDQDFDQSPVFQKRHSCFVFGRVNNDFFSHFITSFRTDVSVRPGSIR